MQPTAHRLTLANGGCVAGQNQKCGLNRILCQVFVMQEATANSQNHRSVALEERGK